jgi:membrane protein implicated in regulation of membrane protease activity
MEWYIWIIIGIVFLIIELFTPGFYHFSIGIGGVATGVLGRLTGTEWQWHLLIFVITTFATFLLMKRFASFLLKPPIAQESNVNALIGQTGIITKSLEPNQKGYVKLQDEEWSCIASECTDTIPEGTLVEVIKLDGNKLTVKIRN